MKNGSNNIIEHRVAISARLAAVFFVLAANMSAASEDYGELPGLKAATLFSFCSADDKYSQGACTAYVIGWEDGAAMRTSLNNDDSPMFCPKSEISFGTRISIFMDWAREAERERQGILNEVRASIAYAGALAKAFPCQDSE